MDFIKKNWEKVLLGVVLLGLAVAVAFLPLKIASEKELMQETRNRILNPQIKPLPPVDLTLAQASLKRAESPMMLDFSTGHRLFNPVLWQKTTDGRPLKVQSGNEIGPAALVVARTAPLYTIISFDNVITNETGARYAIGIERQAAEKLADRRKRQTYASIDTKTEFFTLTGIKGPAQNPTDLVIDLVDSDDEITVARNKPFKRIDGYLADLKYPPENRSWPNRRVGDKLTFAGEEYNIVAINETEVVVSARSGKKTTVRMDVKP
jgi:hypothetical protein